ncbi:MAG: sigma-70 family RNA polymerase sigma factor [Gemmataceae bacterium]|nr:sigma-70 family RNA polymerase sigma factor [Gemmataceae bacterium]MCS7272197.1 sigma-70 family RNA polymerase sigma factor [Gemmataceae bacterium]MDW8242567.1 sigma-70 family RNA polymerase sigma factor [Thermogemmata sp.]
MQEPTDAELVRRFVQQRDADALEALLRRYEQPLFRFLYGTLRDHHAAEDVLQETFVQAMRQLEGVRPEAIRGWLFTVAYQQAVLWKRRCRRWPVLLDEEQQARMAIDLTPRAAWENAEQLVWVQQSLQQLPPAQQAAIVARYYEGKKFREIAAACGCPLNTVLARFHSGLQKLRQWWEKRHGE